MRQRKEGKTEKKKKVLEMWTMCNWIINPLLGEKARGKFPKREGDCFVSTNRFVGIIIEQTQNLHVASFFLLHFHPLNERRRGFN